MRITIEVDGESAPSISVEEAARQRDEIVRPLPDLDGGSAPAFGEPDSDLLEAIGSEPSSKESMKLDAGPAPTGDLSDLKPH